MRVAMGTGTIFRLTRLIFRLKPEATPPSPVCGFRLQPEG